MIDLTSIGGILLPPYPSDIISSQDLIYHDGPLLTLLETRKLGPFLQYWCDCSEDRQSHRWLLFQTTRELIEAYEAKKISLRDLMDISCRQRQIHLSDGIQRWVIEYDRLPEDYKPSADTAL